MVLFGAQPHSSKTSIEMKKKRKKAPDAACSLTGLAEKKEERPLAKCRDAAPPIKEKKRSKEISVCTN